MVRHEKRQPKKPKSRNLLWREQMFGASNAKQYGESWCAIVWDRCEVVIKNFKVDDT
jgi:hypothetical protein